MKLVSSLALALFFTSVEAFGPASPVTGNAFGVSSSTASSAGGMTMRVSVTDMDRRRTFNRVLKEVGGKSSKDAVEQQLLSSSTSTLLEKSNWKVRKSMLRKVVQMAHSFDVEVDPKFGQPPTPVERQAGEEAAGAVRKAERQAFLKTQTEELAKVNAARIQKKTEKKARALSSAEEQKAARAKNAPAVVAEPEPVVAAAPVVAEPEPVVAEAPVAAEAPAAEAAPVADNAVTPKTIKKLRDATGAGMMDCKKALLEADGDQEVAADSLRKKGLSTADKKASRVAAEGKIAFASSGGKVTMVEVNCETDFVGKDASFLGYCEKVASAAVNVNDIESLMTQEVDGETLETTRQAMVSKIGENIQVRRLASRGGEGSTVGCYVHLNRIGVLVEIEGGTEALCTDIAMHVAAMNPPFATPEDVPGDVLEKEKKLLSEQALESGKPPEIVEKMVEGRIRKYLEEICLVSQNYVKDGDKTVAKLLEENGAKMIGFTRMTVGEGIEKKEDDFAAEVAMMAGQKAPEPASA